MTLKSTKKVKQHGMQFLSVDIVSFYWEKITATDYVKNNCVDQDYVFIFEESIRS